MNVIKGFSWIICLLLLGSVFLPVYVQPYEDYGFGIMHESTEEFEETVEEADLDTGRAIPVEKLSPATQQAVEEATANADQRGRDSRFVDISVCSEQVVACDAYSERPEFPKQGVKPDDSRSPSYTVIENNGELYITYTIDSGWDISSAIQSFVKMAVLFPFSAFLSWQTYRYSDSQPRRIQRYAAYGLFLLLLGVAWPYISMFADVSLPLKLPILLAWGGIVVGLGMNRISK